jgi:hypothetical protein
MQIPAYVLQLGVKWTERALKRKLSQFEIALGPTDYGTRGSWFDQTTSYPEDNLKFF